VLLLILLALSYFWEVIAKSDLMSNCILLLVFISFWEEKFKGNLFKKKYLLALIIGFFLLIRSIVIKPLTLFLFSEFVQISWKIKISFFFYFVFFVILISLLILISLPDISFRKEHNPFNHQTRYASKFLIAISLISTFVFSFRVKKSSDIFLYATYILGGLMLVPFILNCIEEGFYDNFYGNLFDISYLSMVIPFVILFFLESFKNEKKTILYETVK